MCPQLWDHAAQSSGWSACRAWLCPCSLTIFMHDGHPSGCRLKRARQRTESPRPSSSAMRLAMGLQPLRLKQDHSHEQIRRQADPLRSPIASGCKTTWLTAEEEHASRDAPSAARFTSTGRAMSLLRPCCHTSSVQREPRPHRLRQRRGSEFPQANSLRSQVMQEYLYTMEQFLNLQQEVMQAFLNGARGIQSSTSAAQRRVPSAPHASMTLQRLISMLPGARRFPALGSDRSKPTSGSR